MDLAPLLERATAGVEPSPTLLRDVRAGGRRRLRRRRATGALALALSVSGAAAVTSVVMPNDRATVRFSGELFDGQEHGDLAGDAAFKTEVIHAWDSSHATSENASRGIFDDLRGEPKVVWAGTTPVGRAAVVVQDAYLSEHADIQLDHEGIYQLIGFVGPGANGSPRVVADTYPAPGTSPDIAWYVDQKRTLAAALDVGKPLGISWKWTYGADGTVGRTYTPLSKHDGIAWLALPPGVEPGLTVRIGLLPVKRFEDVRGILNAKRGPDDSGGGDGRLKWLTGTPSRPLFHLGGSWAPNESALSGRLEGALTARRSGGDSFSSAFSLWYAYGNLADGRQLVVGEQQLENDPSRLYAVIGSGDHQVVVAPGEVDVHAVLPVAVHLPDGQGWVVAQNKAELSYRIGSGAWVPVGTNAALLPEGASAVLVALPGSAPQVVDLL
jgi:hypothetical protein